MDLSNEAMSQRPESTRRLRTELRERSRHAGYRLAAALVLLLLFMIAQALCRAQVPTGFAPVLYAVPSPDEVPSAAALYETALGHAQLWHPDARLAGIEVALGSRVRATFAFDSDSDPTTGILVGFADTPSGRRVTIEEFRHEPAIPAARGISREEWPLDSRDIFAIALENDASDFLRAHPDWREWYLHLPVPRSPDLPDLVWCASVVDFSGDTLEMSIHPVSGEVLQVEYTRGPAPTVAPLTARGAC
jgi:hypothetical protein